MGQKHQQQPDSVSDPKKRRRVGFANADAGVEPKDCTKIYLVSSKEEVEAGNGYCIDPFDLSNFFGEDGKIYGYQGLKITFWVSTVSFQAYVDVTFESSADAGKGITDLKTAFQDIFGENILGSKDEFLQTFSTERDYIRSITLKGEKLFNTSNGNIVPSISNSNIEDPRVEVVRLVVGDLLVGQLYSRLVPLVLLLVDGSSPIDVTDSSWGIYLIVKKTSDQEDSQVILLGLAAVYRFYRYPESSRLRLSQILVLPPYQRKGHGSRLLEAINAVAVSEGVYDFTIEEPLDSLQHVRNCLDAPRLLACSSVQQAVDAILPQLKEANLSKRTDETSKPLLPSPATAEEVRKTLKINKKQFIHCWEILIYLALDPSDRKHMENYKTFITERVKISVLGKDTGPSGKRVIDVPSEYNEEMSFVMHKSLSGEATNIEVDEDQKANVEEQLQKVVEERIERIKAVARKVSPARG